MIPEAIPKGPAKPAISAAMDSNPIFFGSTITHLRHAARALQTALPARTGNEGYCDERPRCRNERPYRTPARSRGPTALISIFFHPSFQAGDPGSTVKS